MTRNHEMHARGCYIPRRNKEKERFPALRFQSPRLSSIESTKTSILTVTGTEDLTVSQNLVAYYLILKWLASLLQYHTYNIIYPNIMVYIYMLALFMQYLQT